jgi:Ca2+-binding EF-hand superfamily protein
MSKIAPAAAFALCAALLAASAWTPAAAARRPDPGATHLFISPPGQPYTAPGTDPYPIVLWFNRLDSNSDGKLDINEFRADALFFFKLLDRNSDGIVDSTEVTYYEDLIVPQVLRRPGNGVEEASLQRLDRLVGDQGAAPYSLFGEPEPVRSADRQFNYRITLQEYLDQSDRHFKILDKTNQGFVTLKDLPKTESEQRTGAHR